MLFIKERVHCFGPTWQDPFQYNNIKLHELQLDSFLLHTAQLITYQAEQNKKITGMGTIEK